MLINERLFVVTAHPAAVGRRLLVSDLRAAVGVAGARSITLAVLARCKYCRRRAQRVTPAVERPQTRPHAVGLTGRGSARGVERGAERCTCRPMAPAAP